MPSRIPKAVAAGDLAGSLPGYVLFASRAIYLGALRRLMATAGFSRRPSNRTGSVLWLGSYTACLRLTMGKRRGGGGGHLGEDTSPVPIL